MPAWRNPLVRAGVTLISVGSVGWAFLSYFISPSPENSYEQVDPAIASQASSEDEIEELRNQIGNYQAKLSDVYQEREMRDIKMAPPKSDEVPPPATTAPIVTRAYVPPPPVVRQPPPPPPQARPIVSKPIPAPEIVEERPKIDPLEQWQALADVGSYGSSSFLEKRGETSAYQPIENDSSPHSQDGQIEGGAGTPPPISNSIPSSETISTGDRPMQISTAAPSSRPMERSQVNRDPQILRAEIPVGERVEAELQTPIAWTGQLQNPNQNFIIKLSEPIEAANGEEILAKGSTLVAKVTQADESGLLQMEVSFVQPVDSDGQPILDKSGRIRKYHIPSGSLLILGGDGGVLQAEAKQPDTIGNDILASVLNGVASAAGLSNRPSGQTFTTFGSEIDYGDSDPVSGLVQGMAGSMAQSLVRQNQSAIATTESMPQVFVLEQGSDVQLYVNESFSLD